MPEIHKLEPHNWERAWEYHKTADELLGTRLNYGMVAQSMLLVSYVTAFCHDPQSTPFLVVELTIAGFGLFYSFVQNRMSRAMIDRLDYLKENYLRKLCEIYTDYLDMPYNRDRRPSYRGNQRLIAPALMVVWVILAVLPICVIMQSTNIFAR